MKATASARDDAPDHVKPAAPLPPADPETGRITRARDGRVFLIGIDRPTKLNGFTPEMCRELAHAYTEFENDSEARCALLFSHGPHLTAGLDLPRMQKVIRESRAFSPEGCVDPFDFLDPHRTKPVVTAMEGFTYTIGLELMLAGHHGHRRRHAPHGPANGLGQRDAVPADGLRVRCRDRASVRPGTGGHAAGPGLRAGADDRGRDCGCGTACSRGDARQCPQGPA